MRLNEVFFFLPSSGCDPALSTAPSSERRGPAHPAPSHPCAELRQAPKFAIQGSRAGNEALQLSEQQPALRGFPEPRRQMVGLRSIRTGGWDARTRDSCGHHPLQRCLSPLARKCHRAPRNHPFMISSLEEPSDQVNLTFPVWKGGC